MDNFQFYIYESEHSYIDKKTMLHIQAVSLPNAIMDLIEFIDLKWNGIRVVSSSDDEFEVVEVLNNREEEQKKKKERKARKRQRTDEAIENERNLNGRNKNGLSQGR
ncbi:uncharacterized protein LOC117101750 isoform X1 [Anneissia japonica]|uniref:uncharacterized protein LOC117101750 isoform X1 n=1 Tax=Anneissia japonica TaxID=1529436 RepID=UPI0014254EED|nr:uncharacterized protein LOC117101750 isoform X1 [Anneissia japonica]